MDIIVLLPSVLCLYSPRAFALFFPPLSMLNSRHVRSLLNTNTTPLPDERSNGAITRYVFKSLKAFWHSSVHSNAFLRTLKNGNHLSVALEINLLRATTRPVKDWTSLMLCRGFISRIALIFSGFASIPLC